MFFPREMLHFARISTLRYSEIDAAAAAAFEYDCYSRARLQTSTHRCEYTRARAQHESTIRTCSHSYGLKMQNIELIPEVVRTIV